MQDLGEESGAAIASPATIHLHVFDVLFRRALGGHPELAQALRACGFDPDHPRERYPAEVWARCLELSRAMLFPDHSPEAGMRALGGLFGDALREGPVGAAYAGIRIRPEVYLARVQRALTRVRPDLEMELSCIGVRQWRIELRGLEADPHFLAGVLDARLRERATAAQVQVLFREPSRSLLEISW